MGSMEQKTQIYDALKHVYSVYINCIYFAGNTFINLFNDPRIVSPIGLKLSRLHF